MVLHVIGVGVVLWLFRGLICGMFLDLEDM